MPDSTQSWNGVERRSIRRTRVLLGGSISEGDSGSRTSCVVKNMSDKGVRIDLPSGMALPGRVHFRFQREDGVREARIVWRAGASAGLCFV
jgi:hypothetical protein